MIHELVFHKIMDNYTALQNDFVTTYTFSFCQIIFFSPLKRWKGIGKSKYHLTISLIIKRCNVQLEDSTSKMNNNDLIYTLSYHDLLIMFNSPYR